MKLKMGLNIAAATIGLALTTGASATGITTGQFVLNFDEQALLDLPAAVVMSAWFDEAASADKAAGDMLTAASQDSVPDAFTFNVFGSTITSPPVGLDDRKPVASTFSYIGDPTTGTGKIGLAGVHQIKGNFNGALVSGDYDLDYDAERIGNEANSSGWYLTNHIGFNLPAYDLTNVSTTIIDDNNFSLSGDVVFTDSNAAMMMTETGVKAGTFTFTTVTSAMPMVEMSAQFASDTNLLTLPSVNVGGTYYKAVLKLAMVDGNIAFDLVTANPASMADNASEFSSAIGMLKIPSVDLVDGSGNITITIANAELTLVSDSNPFQFIYNP